MDIRRRRSKARARLRGNDDQMPRVARSYPTRSATLSTMSMTPARKAHLQIHFCVLLWGFTAIIGKVITLPALPLVWWRMGIVALALALLPRVWRSLRTMSPKLMAAYAGIGVLVALHWLTFYGAIKLANASVAATCIALATVFTAMVEPKLARRPFSPRDLALGIAVLPGVALVVGGIPDSMRIGVVVGALSALFVALFGSLNKRLVDSVGDAGAHGARAVDAAAVPGLRGSADGAAQRPRPGLAAGAGAGLHAVAVRPVADGAAAHERVLRATGRQP